ncbi:response regulator [Mesorhizobium sp. M7A.F.Ca.US.010.02.1.1]|uniref:response regulator n=1 Tax=Mesorhizobium sp. M7A.F.Ca.US.010.02.1.1 TaxID=2496743 RepID=UPI001FDF31B4|nr:response regulator [Mesorhizobium sp. M7A.F.Ca.US.010.02.1.1]
MSESAILVVEDELLILLDLESALQDAGFLVVGVPSAEAAVKAFDEDPNKFAGLFTDIRLGSGESGWEVARHVRRANPTLPVVYISGDGAFSWGSEGVPDSVMIVRSFLLRSLRRCPHCSIGNTQQRRTEANPLSKASRRDRPKHLDNAMVKVDAVARLSQSRPSDAPISRPHRIQQSCSILRAGRPSSSNVFIVDKMEP